jgi:hypothetical protein
MPAQGAQPTFGRIVTVATESANSEFGVGHLAMPSRDVVVEQPEHGAAASTTRSSRLWIVVAAVLVLVFLLMLLHDHFRLGRKSQATSSAGEPAAFAGETLVVPESSPTGIPAPASAMDQDKGCNEALAALALCSKQ